MEMKRIFFVPSLIREENILYMTIFIPHFSQINPNMKVDE